MWGVLIVPLVLVLLLAQKAKKKVQARLQLMKPPLQELKVQAHPRLFLLPAVCLLHQQAAVHPALLVAVLLLVVLLVQVHPLLVVLHQVVHLHNHQVVQVLLVQVKFHLLIH